MSPVILIEGRQINRNKYLVERKLSAETRIHTADLENWNKVLLPVTWGYLCTYQGCISLCECLVVVCFWGPRHAPCRILVLQLGDRIHVPAFGSSESLNYWTTRKSQMYVLMLTYLSSSCSSSPLAMIPVSDGSSGSGPPFHKPPKLILLS